MKRSGHGIGLSLLLALGCTSPVALPDPPVPVPDDDGVYATALLVRTEEDGTHEALVMGPEGLPPINGPAGPFRLDLLWFDEDPDALGLPPPNVPFTSAGDDGCRVPCSELAEAQYALWVRDEGADAWSRTEPRDVGITCRLTLPCQGLEARDTVELTHVIPAGEDARDGVSAFDRAFLLTTEARMLEIVGDKVVDWGQPPDPVRLPRLVEYRNGAFVVGVRGTVARFEATAEDATWTAIARPGLAPAIQPLTVVGLGEGEDYTLWALWRDTQGSMTLYSAVMKPLQDRTWRKVDASALDEWYMDAFWATALPDGRGILTFERFVYALMILEPEPHFELRLTGQLRCGSNRAMGQPRIRATAWVPNWSPAGGALVAGGNSYTTLFNPGCDGPEVYTLDPDTGELELLVNLGRVELDIMHMDALPDGTAAYGTQLGAVGRVGRGVNCRPQNLGTTPMKRALAVPADPGGGFELLFVSERRPDDAGRRIEAYRVDPKEQTQVCLPSP